ncbi:MAG: IS4 family transposase [Verrucomicrobiota bacterium]
MGYKPTVFNQLFNFIPRQVFEKSAKEHGADRYAKSFKAWHQFLLLLYAQATGKQSLREIAGGLQLHQSRLYHLGLKPVPRSTMSDGMERRECAIFEDLFHAMVRKTAGRAPGHRFRFKNPLYSIDASTIDLCLSVFDWAKFRKQKGAIKLHCQLDHAGHIPSFVHISDGKLHDLKAAEDFFKIEPDSIYCFDKAYVSYEWLHSIHKTKAFFVTRAKSNMSYRITGQHGKGDNNGVLTDRIIKLDSPASSRKYPSRMRMVVFKDEETGKVYHFITNNFRLAPATIAAIYKQRWQIELFFKWIKQNLKIKTFLGTSKNAVMAQVWVAMIYYLLLAYIKFMSKTRLSLTDFARRVKEGLMMQMDLLELLCLAEPRPMKPPDGQVANQMAFIL